MAIRENEQIGRYRITSLLGAGGMGAVYRARDTELGRDVALKVIADTADEASVARFRREARSACAFSHPNVATVFDVGTADGRPYLVMELVEGRSLRAYVGDASVPAAQKRSWLLQIARALAAAHRVGLVHRDVKPDNVLVAASGEAKLVDFGIARPSGSVDASAPTAELGAVLTATGAVIGSPAYMPPEQLRGQPVDGRSDQFSWGVMAFEIIAGRRPWPPSESAFEIATSILTGPPVDTRGVEELFPSLGDLLGRCLARAPAERFGSMDEVVDALEAIGAPGADGLAPAPRPSAPGSSTRSVRSATAALAVTAAGSAPARSARPLVLVAVGLAVAAAVVAAAFWRRSTRTEASESAQQVSFSASPASSASASAKPAVPVRHCEEQGKCADRNSAWCDPQGKRLACCLDGLIGTAKGRCECPPGGSTNDVAVQRGCKRATGKPDDIQRVIRQEFDRFRACYEATLKNDPNMKGRISVRFQVAPDGWTYGHELQGVSLPDPTFQDCIVAEFEALRLPPPADGHLSVTYPIVFTPEGQADHED